VDVKMYEEATIYIRGARRVAKLPCYAFRNEGFVRGMVEWEADNVDAG